MFCELRRWLCLFVLWTMVRTSFTLGIKGLWEINLGLLQNSLRALLILSSVFYLFLNPQAPFWCCSTGRQVHTAWERHGVDKGMGPSCYSSKALCCPSGCAQPWLVQWWLVAVLWESAPGQSTSRNVKWHIGGCWLLSSTTLVTAWTAIPGEVDGGTDNFPSPTFLIRVQEVLGVELRQNWPQYQPEHMA